MEKLNIPDLDFIVSYQSRVGPLKWIGPNTEEIITQTCDEKIPLVIVPVAFVSEHSETLVELDIEYRAIANAKNHHAYFRVPALGTKPRFIEALGALCLNEGAGSNRCPKECIGCPCKD